MNEEYSAFYPWSFLREVPLAVRSEGIYIYDEAGKRYLDGSGGAVAVNVGHSVRPIVEDICRTISELSYVHTSHFRTNAGEELAFFLAKQFPGPPQRPKVLFTSGGSEATETAIKLVRQYWLSRNEPNRHKIISRWHGYHGATLGALGVSGNRRRRAPYLDLLPSSQHIPSCFCYHCPMKLEFPSCELACAHELEKMIVEVGAETVAGFLLEPIVGATSGAVPPDRYLPTVREICSRHNIPLIADEIMTGSGRTGRYFAVEQWGVTPDIILMGKGLSGGYAPLGAVLVAEDIWQPIQRAAASLEHSFTYQAHPASVAAGLAVQRHLVNNNLVQRAALRGQYLGERLLDLKLLPCVGDVRGMGLMWTVEFLADSKRHLPFPPEYQFSERVFQALRARGVMLYPGRGTIDGVSGDHVLIAPPFIIENSEIDEMVDKLRTSIELTWASFAEKNGDETQAVL
jgi:adenosylmethionine-8-amino-7-oxononanoate aminotransferase